MHQPLPPPLLYCGIVIVQYSNGKGRGWHVRLSRSHLLVVLHVLIGHVPEEACDPPVFVSQPAVQVGMEVTSGTLHLVYGLFTAGVHLQEPGPSSLEVRPLSVHTYKRTFHMVTVSCHTHARICSCVYLFHRHSLTHVRTSNVFTHELFRSLPYTLHTHTHTHFTFVSI